MGERKRFSSPRQHLCKFRSMKCGEAATDVNKRAFMYLSVEDDE